MAIANASQFDLVYGIEASYGAGGSTGFFLRGISNGLNPAKGALISEERRSDGQIPFVRHGNFSVGGSIDFELSYLAFKDMFRNALRYSLTGGRFISSIDSASVTLTWAASDDSVTRASGSFVTDGAAVGMRVRVTNPSGNAAQQDVILTLIAVTATKLTFAENVIADASQISGTCIFECDYAEDGVTDSSLWIDREFTDVVLYGHITGARVSGFSLNWAIGAFVTGSFDVIGQDYDIDATPADSSAADVDTAEPFSSDSGAIEEGGSASAIITALTLNYANGRAPLNVLGDPNPVEISAGRHMLSGSLTALFTSAALANKFLDETASSLLITNDDPAGNQMAIRIPALKYTSGEITSAGDDVVSLAANFQAYRDSTRGTTIEISMTPDTAAV